MGEGGGGGGGGEPVKELQFVWSHFLLLPFFSLFSVKKKKKKKKKETK